MEDILSITEAAALYGKSRTAFVWLVATGRIPHRIIGKRQFVMREDVMRLIANRNAPRQHNARIEAVS
jgi:uncharacterized protein (DUF1778 family)